ncbi:MAG: hypothetical protein DRH56_06470, partial [Deltaproteobacteria bacterium]
EKSGGGKGLNGNDPGGGAKVKFLADAMVGRLARWLRVLGYDTYYRSSYPGNMLDRLMREDRYLLSRKRETVERYGAASLVHGNRVGEQITRLRRELPLTPDPGAWFTRCLVCNNLLRTAGADAAHENVPDYVFHVYPAAIRYCPSCGRYYWQGSHRERMIRQLKAWGFLS